MFTKYLKENWGLHEIHKKSVFFHTKLKKMNMFEDGDNLVEEIRREIESISVNGGNNGNEDEDEENYRPATKRRRVSREDSIIDEFSTSNFSDVTIDEVQQYLNSLVVVPTNGKINLFQYWYENRELYPTLFKLSLKYLCVPASSATAESKFHQ